MTIKRYAAMAFLLAAFMAVECLAQTPMVQRPDFVYPLGGPAGSMTAAARGTVIDNRIMGITTWHLVYSCSGCSAVSIRLDYATDSAGAPGSWTVWPAADLASGTTLPLTSTANGQATGFKYQPWVSANLTTLTGTGARVTGVLYGWRAGPGENASALGVAASSSGVDPTTFRVVYTSAQTNAAILAAPAAGNRLVIVGLKVTSSTTANVTWNIGLHPTVTPTGLGSVDSHAAASTTGGSWMQAGGTSIGTGASLDALLITTGTIADGALHVVVKYIVEVIP